MAELISFESEYILQKITEDNLDLFGLEFVASEFQYKGLRFDTLAFDGDSNSFVIIEYKNKFDAGVLNQVKGYYDLLLENKQVYIDRLNEESEVKLKENDLDNTRAMIIGPKFSDEQIDEVESPFEIWKVSLYDNLNVEYKQLKTNETKVLKVTEEDLKITDEDLLKDKSDELKELYCEITNRVLKDFGDVGKKNLVGAFTFRLGNSKDYKYLISKLIFKNDYFLVYLYSKQAIIDEKLEDISNNDNIEGKASYRFKLESFEDIDYFMEMFKKVYGEKIHE